MPLKSDLVRIVDRRVGRSQALPRVYLDRMAVAWGKGLS